jgi:anti-sigma B factor antagonist
MREIEIRTSEVGRGRVLVRLEGELDIASAGEVEQAMARQEQEGCQELILDLGGLRFIDSTGLRLVLSAHGRAQKGGWGFSIVPGPDRVQRVFEVAGVRERLRFQQEGSDAGH